MKRVKFWRAWFTDGTKRIFAGNKRAVAEKARQYAERHGKTLKAVPLEPIIYTKPRWLAAIT